MNSYVFRLLTMLIISGLLFSACDEEGEGTTPTPDVPEEIIPSFSVIAQVGEEEYMTATDTLTSGKISIIGQGIETQTFGSAVGVGGYVYLVNGGDESTIDQYQVTEKGYEKIASIAVAPLSPVGRFRIIQKVSDSELLLFNWPDDNDVAPYAVVEIPSFTVKTNGTFTVPKVAGFDPVEANGIVKDDKIYLGTMYSNRGAWDSFPDSLITWVYDYPTFENGRMIVSTASLGTVAGFSGPSAILDEQGDIYQQNIRSKHWYNMGTREEMPSVFVRIRDGEYDDSYVFNISDQFPSTVSLIGVQYVGNGIAYGKLLDEDATNEWDQAWSENYTSVVRIDLYNQTVTKLNIPPGPFIAIDGGVLLDDKLYWPISPVGGAAHVYEIDINGGADAFTVGAELDGNSVRAFRIMQND